LRRGGREVTRGMQERIDENEVEDKV
jgi:hypothetical protein